MTIINTRADYDAAPQEEQERFLKMLAAGSKQWKWQDGDWQLVTDTSAAERFGFTDKELPELPEPKKPDYNPDEQADEQLRAEIDGKLAAIDARLYMHRATREWYLTHPGEINAYALDEVKLAEAQAEALRASRP